MMSPFALGVGAPNVGAIAYPGPNPSFQADRNPRERGLRPLNSNR